MWNLIFKKWYKQTFPKQKQTQKTSLWLPNGKQWEDNLGGWDERTHTACTHTKSPQSCSTPCDSMDCSPPGSSLHGILQARILEWVTMPSSRGSSHSRDWSCISYISCIGRQVLYHWHHLGNPQHTHTTIYKIVLCGTGNSTQYSVIACIGKES